MLGSLPIFKHAFHKPEAYHTHSDLQYAFAHNIIKNIEFKPTDNILDIGCGDGKITADIAKMVPLGQVVGTDISHKMIEFARKKYELPNKGRLSFMVMDAEENIFHDQFNVIVSFSCLQWVQNQLDALIGMKNALVPGGRVILHFILKHEIESIVGVTALSPKWQGYFIDFKNPRFFCTLEEYERLLEKSGLQKESIKKESITYEFHSQRELELFLGNAISNMQRIPKDKQDEFLSDIVSFFLYTNDFPNREIKLTWPALVINATRV